MRMRSSVDIEIAIGLRNNGATLQEIGDKFGVSRERVRQLLNKHSAGGLRCLDCGKPIHSGRYCRKHLELRKAANKQRYSEHSRKAYVDLRAKDICVACRNAHADSGVLCSNCREIARERSRDAYNKKHAERLSSGLCPKCGGKREDESFILCERCRDIRRTYASRMSNTARLVYLKRVIAKYIAEGRCSRCGGEIDMPGRRLCSACAERRELHRTDMIDSGLCPSCGKPRESNASLCKRCSEKNNARHKILYNERKEAGLCPKCGGKRDIRGRTHCSACLARMNKA
jgi:predicted amidophosphoribosyltransferase